MKKLNRAMPYFFVEKKINLIYNHLSKFRKVKMEKQIEKEFEKTLKAIEKAKNIVIIGHSMPDGDSIGSQKALKYFLEYLGKNVYILAKNISLKVEKTVNTDDIINSISEFNLEEKDIDISIFVDMPNLTRVDEEFKDFKDTKFKICIDHHEGNELFGDINIHKIMTSTTELVYLLIKYYFKENYSDFMNSEKTREFYLKIMKNIMLGLITDSGGFRHQNMNTLAFNIAAEAMENNIDLFNIYRINIIEKSETEFNLDKYIRDRIQFLLGGKIAFMYLTKEDKCYMEKKVGEDESLVNIGKEYEGNKISILVKEVNDGFKFSVRTNVPYSAYNIAKAFNGGGHIGAAGADIFISNMDKLSKEEKMSILNFIKEKLVLNSLNEINKVEKKGENC